MHSNSKRKALSRRRRFEVLERCGYRCVYCGRGSGDGAVLQVEHALPVARGGGDESGNLVAGCVDCNYGKRDRVVALPEFPELPARPAHLVCPVPLARTFLDWLRGQTARDDIVGDLARDEGRDRLVEPTSFKHLAEQIRDRNRCGTWVPDGSPVCAAWHAWREYRRGGRPTLLLERIRVRNERAEREARERGAAVWKFGVLS